MECIWSAGDTSDVVAHMTVYKVIGDIVTDLRPAGLDIIVGHLKAVPQAAYTATTLELLRDMCSTIKNEGGAAAADAAVDLLWAAATDAAECPIAISRDALQKLSSLFSCVIARCALCVAARRELTLAPPLAAAPSCCSPSQSATRRGVWNACGRIRMFLRPFSFLHNS